MIIPSRWFSGGMGLSDFRKKMLNDKRIRIMVDYQNSKECFPDNSMVVLTIFYGIEIMKVNAHLHLTMEIRLMSGKDPYLNSIS